LLTDYGFRVREQLGLPTAIEQIRQLQEA
jgi:hypothetical protein